MGLMFSKRKKSAERYRIGMEKTRRGPFARLKRLFTGYNTFTEAFFDELEEIFVMADIGVETTVRFVDELKADSRLKNIHDPKEIQQIIIDKMFDLYLKGEIVNSNLNINKNNVSVFLFVGVNGSGKTTTIAKIANKFSKEGKKVIIAAADTFRAGAVDQLRVWAERAGARVITKKAGSDPSSVVFEALKIAKEESYDIVLCDTAGRLQTKVNLMNELKKIKRVIAREVADGPHDTLLVIDATTGQNGLSQARAFMEATEVTGVILTKLDGTAKGGIVLAIRDIYSVPIKFVCLGEGLDDIEYFDLENYIYGLFAEMVDEV